MGPVFPLAATLTIRPSSQSHADSNVWLPRDICFVIFRLNRMEDSGTPTGATPEASSALLSPSVSSSCKRSPPPSRELMTFFFVSCWIFHACAMHACGRGEQRGAVPTREYGYAEGMRLHQSCERGRRSERGSGWSVMRTWEVRS